MNIAQMPAGREMDALVAERAMRWNHKSTFWMLGYVFARNDTWSPSTDVGAAMELKDRMVGDGFNFSMFESATGIVQVSFVCSSGPCARHGNLLHNHHGAYDVEADTVPLAICRASLVALKISLEKS